MENLATVRKEPAWFEDVEIGDQVPALVKGPYTIEKNTRFASVFGDFCAGHYDYRAARKYSHNDIPIAFGRQIMVHLSQVITDWCGPNARLKKFSCQVRTVVYDGESLTMKGKVTGKQEVGGQHLVHCGLWGEKADGTVAVTGTATVAFPSRLVGNSPAGRRVTQ